MPPENDHNALLWATALALIVANLATLVMFIRLRKRTGRPVLSVLRRRRWRMVLVGGLALAGILVLLAGEGVPTAAALCVLALAAMNVAFAPGFMDSIYGEQGVAFGWHARRFDELDAWRLTGDHLRWKLRGIWLGSDVPARLHPELRARLEATCPERESAFKQ